ncbi:MAG: tetratricopeptide repeat protein [Muribaculaceae bacterium]|nr:tetratricopeptide repeat protein [Muribaculaceae bacterium]
MSLKSIISFAFSVIISFSVYAVSPNTDIANQLYESGEYKQAAEAYLSIAQVDGFSPELYFNIANSYAQAGDLGNAILYYSRANRLDPSNKLIKNNLEYFASKVEDSNRAELRGKKISVAPDHETFFQTVNRLICADVAPNVWAVLAAILFIITLVAIAIYLFCSNVRLRKVGFFGGILTFFASIFFVIFAFMSASYFDSHDTAVLMAYKTELLIEPSSDAKAASNQLCQGTRFEIIAEETDVQGQPTWYKVRLNSDIEGWLRASDLAII